MVFCVRSYVAVSHTCESLFLNIAQQENTYRGEDAATDLLIFDPLCCSLIEGLLVLKF